jgi:hypothetical protein
MNPLAFISDDKGIALFVRYDLLALWKQALLRHT